MRDPYTKDVAIRKLFFAVTIALITHFSTAREVTIGVSEVTKASFPHLIELAQKAVEAAGHTPVLLELPGARASAMMLNEELDLDPMRLVNYNDAVPTAIRIDGPVNTLDLYAYVGPESTVNSNADLPGLKMAAVRGVVLQFSVAAELGIRPVVQNDMEASAKMVESGRVDFSSFTIDIAEPLLASGIQMRRLADPITKVPFFPWLGSQAADLKEPLAEAYQSLIADYQR